MKIYKSKKNESLINFLKGLMQRRKLLPTQLASELGVSHASISRWLSGLDMPSIKSCSRLAEYADTPIDIILSVAGYLPESMVGGYSTDLPNFREYAKNKYPSELDEDIIVMIEDLIERKRDRKREAHHNNSLK